MCHIPLPPTSVVLPEFTDFEFYKGSGIGRDASIAYALEGARTLVLADINLASVKETAKQCREAASSRGNDSVVIHALQVDVSSEESVNSMVQEAVAKAGRIDYCVNSAGVSWHTLY